MKTIVIVVPDCVENRQIVNALKDMSGQWNAEIDGSIIGDNKIEAVSFLGDLKRPIIKNGTQKPRMKSKFMQALDAVVKACDEAENSCEFRVIFYRKILDKIIERPIIEVLAFGPKNTDDSNYLKKMIAKDGCTRFVGICEFAKIALSLIS